MSYTGRILEINLTTGKVKISELSKHDQKCFIGSRGLGAKILYDSVSEHTSPFDPGNPLIFFAGPLTGTPAFGPGGYFTTVSPLTNGYMDSGVKGHFPANIKLAGFDGFIIRGKSEKPVYLYVDNEKMEIKNAQNIWGKDCFETDEFIKDELKNKSVHVASIGPAGENKVRYASISSDLYRQAGRGGVGAVMGSKNLKAIVVRGDGALQIEKPKEFLKLVKELHTYIKENAEPLRSYGTLWLVDTVNEHMLLPTSNFRWGQIEHPEKLNGEYVIKKGNKRDKGCYSCSLMCSNLITFKSPSSEILTFEGPEYESLALLGPNCGLEEFEEIAYLNFLCDKLGIDTISVGGVIAFAMELFEKGILTKDDTDGLSLSWGNFEAMVDIIHSIAYRKGIGNILAEGSKKSAEIFGKDSLKFAMQVKGMEIPGYDPRGATGMALAYATSDRGACHLRAWTIYEEVLGSLDQYGYKGKAALVAARQNRKLIIDSLGICEQLGLLPLFANLYSAATGLNVTTVYNDLYNTMLEDFTIDGCAAAGSALYTLTRAFNVKRGFSRKDDNLPKRFFEESLKTLREEVRPLKEDAFNNMINEYYVIKGWDKDGRPLKQTLEGHMLEKVIKDLY